MHAENDRVFHFNHVNRLTDAQKKQFGHGHSIFVDIGREKRTDDPSYFNLSESNTMSKKHARIFWDPIHEGFYIENLSKNKIQVDNEEVCLGQEPRKLTNLALIMIAKVRCYFLLPLQ